jgi:murein DD-endopeptidase MepM/ murein hydrolase activator NlpD
MKTSIIEMRTNPRRVFKEPDQAWPNDKFFYGYTESWSFWLVALKDNKPIHPVKARIRLLSGPNIVRTLQLAEYGLKGTSMVYPKPKARVAVWNCFSEPEALEIDRLDYTLVIADDTGSQFSKTLKVRLERYTQKAKLIFPVKGKCMVACGHDYNECHRWERSQSYAYDVHTVGPQGELFRGNGKSNEDWWCYGTPVIAPADGFVVHARDDIPENEKPFTLPDWDSFKQYPNWLNAAAGNNVVIDHGDSEYSMLGHLKHGTVTVQEGARVKQGQQIGCLGNSGNSDAPHLHYHLMDGPEIFMQDGLPSRFENVELLGYKMKVSSPKRGLFLLAK